MLASLLLGSLAIAQPLPNAPFTLDAAEVTLQEIEGRMEMQATGGITFQQTGKTITATGATLRLVHPSGSTSLTDWVPSELLVQGRVTFLESSGDRASAGNANYNFAEGRLRLSGGAQWSRGESVVKASSATITEEGDLVVAEGVVTASLSGLQILEQGDAQVTTITATRADWRSSNNEIVANGEPVQVVQGGITLTAPKLTFAAPGGVLQALDATGGVVVHGDLEGRGQQMRLEATSAHYDPKEQMLTLKGPVSIQRQGSSGTASSAEVRQNPRAVRLYGFQGGVSLGESSSEP